MKTRLRFGVSLLEIFILYSTLSCHRKRVGCPSQLFSKAELELSWRASYFLKTARKMSLRLHVLGVYMQSFGLSLGVSYQRPGRHLLSLFMRSRLLPQVRLPGSWLAAVCVLFLSKRRNWILVGPRQRTGPQRWGGHHDAWLAPRASF